jgi:hypothetical protein
VAKYATSKLTEGTHIITATYNGSAGFIVNVRGTTRLTSAAIGEALNRVCDVFSWLMSARAMFRQPSNVFCPIRLGLLERSTSPAQWLRFGHTGASQGSH